MIVKRKNHTGERAGYTIEGRKDVVIKVKLTTIKNGEKKNNPSNEGLKRKYFDFWVFIRNYLFISVICGSRIEKYFIHSSIHSRASLLLSRLILQTKRSIAIYLSSGKVCILICDSPRRNMQVNAHIGDPKSREATSSVVIPCFFISIPISAFTLSMLQWKKSYCDSFQSSMM
jgi:hypothetical protein